MKTERISQPRVMWSAAGYYIGRSYYDNEVAAYLPHSRLSDYFATRDIAEAQLAAYVVTEDLPS